MYVLLIFDIKKNNVMSHFNKVFALIFVFEQKENFV